MSKCLFVWALLVLSFCMVLIPSPWSRSRPSLLHAAAAAACGALPVMRVVLCTGGLPADLPAFFPQTLGSTPQVHHKRHKCASSQQTQNATIRPE